MTGRRRAPALVLALLFVAAGCKMGEVQPPGEPPTSNIDELQRRIAHQESVIESQLAARDKPADELQQQDQPAMGGAVGPTVQSAAPAPPEAAEAPPEREEAPGQPVTGSNAPARKSAAVGASVGSTCDLVCRALASMRRSADRICELVGDSDPRCSQAKKQVDDAARRVRSASCTCDG